MQALHGAHWTKSPAEAFRKADATREKRIDQNKRNDSNNIFSPGVVNNGAIR